MLMSTPRKKRNHGGCCRYRSPSLIGSPPFGRDYASSRRSMASARRVFTCAVMRALGRMLGERPLVGGWQLPMCVWVPQQP